MGREVADEAAREAVRVPVSLEVGSKRVFARALDWPGWTRGGRTDDEAVATLATYADRYGHVVVHADVRFVPPADASGLDVVERLTGGHGTDFGVPGRASAWDDRPIDGAEADRLERILRACWRAFDRIADTAEGVELVKGPRGGGRDLGKIRAHVREADEGYVAQLGAKPPRAADWEALRDAAVAAFAARARGDEPENANRVTRKWQPRYFVHRAAWHLLDHAWEIQDRAIR